LVDPEVIAIPDAPAGPVESWEMHFKLPQAPMLTLNSNSGVVGSFETGEITPTYSETGLDFLIKIPRGTRFFVENDLSDIDTSLVKVGDLCLINDDTSPNYGDVYKWNGTNWILDTHLRGPVGKSLNILNANINIDSRIQGMP